MAGFRYLQDVLVSYSIKFCDAFGSYFVFKDGQIRYRGSASVGK